ncbi:hypothetical protein ACOMHN_003932 [Nucella lapillus]
MQRSNNEFSITTGRDGSRSFGEHDDRWAPRGRGNNRRKFNNRNYGRGPSRGGRGRGRGSQGGNNYYRGNRDGGSEPVDPEGDVMMGGDADQGSARRYNPYSARPMSRHGKRGNQHYKNNRYGHHQDASSLAKLGVPLRDQSSGGKAWYKVTIPYAKNLEKQKLMDLLGSCVPSNFRPFQFAYQGHSAIFFLDDADVADILKRHSKTFNFPNQSQKMAISVRPSSPPVTSMDEEAKGKLTTVMSARYDPSVKVLDLTSLHDDSSLLQEGMFIPLNRHNMANCVASIIEKNIPELVGLNLSKNRLLSLTSMQDMATKAPNVTSLNLGNNQLYRIEELDKIKRWSLTELILDGNPLCSKFSKTDYISAVRKRFPKVVKLDGNDLPPAITFDVSLSVLPTSQGSYFMNSEVQDLVVRFLKEYYSIYDSDNRQNLVDAYHKSALFSMTASNNPAMEYKQPFLSDYFPDSRNPLRIKGDELTKARTMDKRLKKGRQQVVAGLGTLPKTTHDPNSFVVDVNLVSSTLLSFVVNGLFKESDNRADKPPIRAFSRCFIVVPANGGILITNDTLTITNATSEQQQAAFKSTGPTPSSSPVSSNPPGPLPSTSQAVSPATPAAVGAGASPAAAAGALSPEQQLERLAPQLKQMVLSFSEKSNMNYIFSFRCLEDNAWDYDKSAKVFIGLQAEGKIPPEAFVR